MSFKSILTAGAMIAIAVISIGCRATEPIDPDTALGLLKDRSMEPVKLTFSASPPTNGSQEAKDAYARLVDAHVITCNTTTIGTLCQPGPAGDALTQVGAAELAVVAGRWVPATVTNFSHPQGTGVTADVHMTFELSPLYRDFEGAFDAIQIWAGKSAIESKKEGKIAHAVFQHYDDGWHLENIS